MKRTQEDYLKLYQGLHDGTGEYLVKGSDKKNRDVKQRMFDGSNFYEKLWSHFKELIGKRKSFRVLDFGSGKAKHLYEPHLEGKTFHQFFGGAVQEYYCYDPGYLKYSRKPADGAKFDALICADVMEHIPDENVDEVIEQMKNWMHPDAYAFFSISGMPAIKSFTDGENLHCNVQPLEYWTTKLKNLSRRYVLVYSGPNGQITFRRI